jgi:hypothetical protein
MGRKFLGILAGLIVALLLVSAADMLSTAIHPPPPGLDLRNPVQLKTFVDSVPLSAKIVLLIGYNLAAFVGGWVAARAGKGAARVHASIGILVLIGTLFNLAAIPHPLWFGIAAVVSLIATTVAGAALCAKIRYA